MEDVEGEAPSEATILSIDEQRGTCKSVLRAFDTSAQDVIKACFLSSGGSGRFDMQIMNYKLLFLRKDKGSKYLSNISKNSISGQLILSSYSGLKSDIFKL